MLVAYIEMKRVRFFRVVAICLTGSVGGVGLSLTGCRHAPAPAVTRAEGRGKFEFVTPPPSPAADNAKAGVKEMPTSDVWVEPRPIGTMAEPVYPAAALAAKAGPVAMGVRIVVDVEGRVREVSSSVLSWSTPTPWAAEFRAAIEAAVAQWRFRPGEVRHFTTVTNDKGSYRSMTGSEKTEWALHVAFTFNTTGQVPSVMTGAGAVK